MSTSLADIAFPGATLHRQRQILITEIHPCDGQHSEPIISERLVPSLLDTSLPFWQLLAAEQTAQSIQAWIQRKKDHIRMMKQLAVEQEHHENTIWHDDIILHGIKLLEKDVDGFKRLLESNEASRQLWRRFHMRAWRATVRPLKVVDLPNEILTMIFANFEDVPVPQIQIEAFPSDEDLPSPDVASIMNIRLTCRTLCEVASRFLLPVVDISFTRSSVQRLAEISNHATISKGVQIIRVYGDAYNSSFANSRQDFCDEIVGRLSAVPRRFEAEARQVCLQVDKDCRLVGLIPEPKFLEIRGLEILLKDAQDLMVIVQDHMHRESQAVVPLDPFEKKIHKAIVQAHEDYKRRYLEQESLAQDARICANISTAIGMMPSVQRLCVTTSFGRRGVGIFGSSAAEPSDAQKWKSAMRSPNLFRDMMVQRRVWNRSLLAWDGNPPFSLILKLPLVLQAGNGNLTHLDIEFPTFFGKSQPIEGEHLRNLRHACQQLKYVQIRISGGMFALSSHVGLATIYTLIDAMLVSPGLEVIKLDLMGQRRIFPGATPSIGPLLAGLSWDKLRSVSLFYVHVKVDELRQLLGKVPGKIHLDLTGISLLEGTWVEALEVLRGRADFSSKVVDPRGVEMATLSQKEVEYLRQEFNSEHRDGFYSAQRCPGPASFYIRGGNIPNPLIRGDE